MGPMDRDPVTDDCIRRDGRKAGQSKRKNPDPRIIMKSIRFSVGHEERADQLIAKHGYRCQADMYADAIAALGYLLGDTPPPPFARITHK